MENAMARAQVAAAAGSFLRRPSPGGAVVPPSNEAVSRETASRGYSGGGAGQV
jgi:hypothetical protein